jgi:hypothetical protein
MKIEHISAGANFTLQRNDDHVALFTSAGVADIVVIDGGSSVAERDYQGAISLSASGWRLPMSELSSHSWQPVVTYQRTRGQSQQ